MPHILDLGHNIFRAPESNRYLVSNVIMVITFPASKLLSSSLTWEMLTSTTTWIVHSPRIALDICIHANSNLTGPTPAFLDHAVNLLRNARVSQVSIYPYIYVINH
jgi:hypothetical protein